MQVRILKHPRRDSSPHIAREHELKRQFPSSLELELKEIGVKGNELWAPHSHYNFIPNQVLS